MSDQFETALGGVEATANESATATTATTQTTTPTLKDALRDIVAHTMPLGVIERFRIDNADGKTTIYATDQAGRMYIHGTLHHPLEGFEGAIGMKELNLLNQALKAKFLDGGSAVVEGDKDENGRHILKKIVFDGPDGASWTHRILPETVVNDEMPVKPIVFGPDTADSCISFEALPDRLADFKYAANAIKGNDPEFAFDIVGDVAQTNDAGEPTGAIENGKLVALFGRRSGTHGVQTVMAENVTGAYSSDYSWDINLMLPMLGLLDNAKSSKLHLMTQDWEDEEEGTNGTDGGIRIDVDSGLANWVINFGAMSSPR